MAKKSIYDCMSYSCYRYAPESFKLFLNNNRIDMNSELASKLGNILVCQGEKALITEIKRHFRKYSAIRNNANDLRFRLCIVEKNNKDVIYLKYESVKQYDIKEHLENYKNLLLSLKENDYKDPVSIHKMELDAGYKIKSVKEQTNRVELGNKVVLRRITA